MPTASCRHRSRSRRPRRRRELTRDQTRWSPTIDVPVRREPAKRLAEGVERAVPRPVPEHLAGAVDARRDPAAHVLARRLGVLGPDAPLELRPVDEVDHRLTAEPSGDAGGEAAQRHGLLGHHVEARSDRGRPPERPLEGLRDVVRVHVVQHAEPEIRQSERLAGRQPAPDVEIEVAGRRDRRPRPGDVPGMQHHARDSPGDRLAVQQRLDRRLAGSVLAVAVRGSSSVTGTRATGPWTQMLPQCNSSGRAGRSASTRLRADSGVKQSMSTTASGARPAIRSPNTPAASSASRSTATRSTLRHSGAGRYGSRSPRLSATTSWPARTRRGTR